LPLIECCLAFLLLAVPEPDGFWTGSINSDVPATIAGGKVLDARGVSQLLESQRPLIVDVSNQPQRPANLIEGAPWLPPPHQGIPDSVWVPGVGAGQITPHLDQFFRHRLAEWTRGNLDHPLIVYCHERCWLSWNAAKRVIGYGYRRVHWFPDGIEGWIAAGLETAFIPPTEPAQAAE
jgi:PQQ-dependent catabolism-associated CXXCW motif protein